MNKNIINILYYNKYESIDIHFGRLIASGDQDAWTDLFLAGALVSRATREGHICLDLNRWADQTIGTETNKAWQVRCPALVPWRRKLAGHPMVGKPGDFRPLILDSRDRLYLQRYWDYENRLAEALLVRARKNETGLDLCALGNRLAHQFKQGAERLNQEQLLAVSVALLKKLCVISGGPGTGKTFAITTIIGMLLAQKKDWRHRLWLAAPTGKAAARLIETVQANRHKLPEAERLASVFPTQAFTIHRLLQPLPNSPYFFYNRENPLPAETVIVDEASMVDLPLMSKLVQALPPTARLILCGDKDQLASVDAGAVLADICGEHSRNRFSFDLADRIDALTDQRLSSAYVREKRGDALGDCRVFLTRAYRFAEHSGIHRVSRKVNDRDWRQALEILSKGGCRTIDWFPLISLEALYRALAKIAIERYRNHFGTQGPQAALANLNRFKVLCAVRQGPLGVKTINRRIEEHLTDAGLIDRTGDRQWYPGRPVLITHNRHDLGLFNGDMGLVLPVPDSGTGGLRVYFPGHDGPPRSFLPSSLPEHETAYAMTVHKCQGSEFETIVLILPRSDSPVLTKELLYTGITRARRQISIWSTETALKRTIGRCITRTSGLGEKLREGHV